MEIELPLVDEGGKLNHAMPADTLHENLTVEEMLMYTAELKRPVNESFEEASATARA